MWAASCLVVKATRGHLGGLRAELWVRGWLETSSTSPRGRGAVSFLGHFSFINEKLARYYFIFTSGQQWEYRFSYRLYFLNLRVLLSDMHILVTGPRLCDSVLIFTSLLSTFLSHAVFDLLQKLMWKSIKRIF